MKLDPNNEMHRALAVTRLVRLRTLYNARADKTRKVPQKQYDIEVCEALECALLALGVPATEWDKL